MLEPCSGRCHCRVTSGSGPSHSRKTQRTGSTERRKRCTDGAEGLPARSSFGAIVVGAVHREEA